MGVWFKSIVAAYLIAAGSWVFAEEFELNTIRVEGLQRVSLGSVLTQLTIREGDIVEESDASIWLSQVYDTGYFYSVDVERSGNDIIINVVERPAIEEVEYSGNSRIPDASLDLVFDDIGLESGEIYRQSLLENVELELEKQYAREGRYNASVEVEVVPLTRNRVNISLEITEGPVAKIEYIEFVGNQVFSDDVLFDTIQLTESSQKNLFQLFSQKDQFSSAVLTGDLQRLEDWYFDHGYLDFQVNSQNVSISENKADITVTISMTEGLPYEISEVVLTGDLKHMEPQIQSLVQVEAGTTYSRKDVSASVQRITDFLGEQGYAFAQVRDFNDLDRTNQQVAVSIQVQPGSLVYVDRIIVQGNTATNDEVIRREMRQYERALLKNSRIRLSQARLERLGYFNRVNIQTERIPGKDDLVNLVVDVDEANDQEINASAGYEAGAGFFGEVSFSQNNFMGRGIDFSAAFKLDSTTQNYQLSLDNPYFTDDGVSLGADIYYIHTDYNQDDIDDYALNTYGGVVTLGYPLSENQRISYGFGGSQDEIILDDTYATLEMTDFVDEYGENYSIFFGRTRWSYNTLNGTVKADKGRNAQVNLDVATPLGELDYYILTLNAQQFVNFADDFALRLHTDLGYADSYGGELFPFYKNFSAGGNGSVRGFVAGSLGPSGTAPLDEEGNPEFEASPIGGNIKVEYGAELIIPTPLVSNQDAYRTALFVDAGNVFSDQCYSNNAECNNGIEYSEIRYSAGVSFTWITPIAPLTFSYAWPLNEKEGDEISQFGFALGVVY